MVLGRRITWSLTLTGLALLVGCADPCFELRRVACDEQQLDAPECKRDPAEVSKGKAGPRQSLCERSLILYRSGVKQ